MAALSPFPSNKLHGRAALHMAGATAPRLRAPRVAFVRSNVGGSAPFGRSLPFASLGARVRFGLLLREVLARSLRRVGRDCPRRVLHFVRASEVRAKVRPQTLRVNPEFVRERLRRNVLRHIRHSIHLLRSIAYHRGHTISNERTYRKRTNVRIRTFYNTLTFVRTNVRTNTRSYDYPPQGGSMGFSGVGKKSTSSAHFLALFHPSTLEGR